MDDNPRTLAAGRCRRCGQSFHPERRRCPHCRSADVEAIQAGPRGRLYSHSTVHVGRGGPLPYTVGYVDLDGGPRVLGRVRTEAPESVPCDAEVLLVEPGPDEWSGGRPLNVFVPTGGGASR